MTSEIAFVDMVKFVSGTTGSERLNWGNDKKSKQNQNQENTIAQSLHEILTWVI